MNPRAVSALRCAVPITGLVVSFVLALGGCKKNRDQPIEPPKAASNAAPIASSPPPAPAPPAPSPVAYDSDPLYQQAQKLSSTDLPKAIALLEAPIAKAPDEPRSAPYYLLLGRLNKRYEEACESAGDPPPGQPPQPCGDFRQYAAARPNEYFHDESSDSYLYSGFHFSELEKRFPSNPLAVEAAYEVTTLSQGGECEGQLVCYIESGFVPMQKFLLRYPDSSHTEQALRRADDAFRKTLWGDHWKTDWTEVTDPNKATEFYDPADLRKLVQEYEDLAEKLPTRFRARPWETVAYYRNRLGETARARGLYEKIVQQFPDYENISEIRSNLARLTR